MRTTSGVRFRSSVSSVVCGDRCRLVRKDGDEIGQPRDLEDLAVMLRQAARADLATLCTGAGEQAHDQRDPGRVDVFDPENPSVRAPFAGGFACMRPRVLRARCRRCRRSARSRRPSPLGVTVASSLGAIILSSQTQDQFQRVVMSIVGIACLVHHVLDQEHAPAAGRLQPFELGVEIGASAGSTAWSPPWSVMRTHTAASEADTETSTSDVGLILVAVLHRVHGGLAGRGLEPLQPRR